MRLQKIQGAYEVMPQHHKFYVGHGQIINPTVANKESCDRCAQPQSTHLSPVLKCFEQSQYQNHDAGSNGGACWKLTY